MCISFKIYEGIFTCVSIFTALIYNDHVPMSKQSQVISHGWHLLGKLANSFACNTFINKLMYSPISCLHNISMDSLKQVSPTLGLQPTTEPRPVWNWATQVAGKREIACSSTYMSWGHSRLKLHLCK